MSSSVHPKASPRQIASRCLAYLAALTFFAFLYFIVFDFGDNRWPVLGFLSIALLIVANTVSHTGSGGEGRKLLRDSPEHD